MLFQATEKKRETFLLFSDTMIIANVLVSSIDSFPHAHKRLRIRHPRACIPGFLSRWLLTHASARSTRCYYSGSKDHA